MPHSPTFAVLCLESKSCCSSLAPETFLSYCFFLKVTGNRKEVGGGKMRNWKQDSRRTEGNMLTKGTRIERIFIDWYNCIFPQHTDVYCPQGRSPSRTMIFCISLPLLPWFPSRAVAATWAGYVLASDRRCKLLGNTAGSY